jgi:hypothetical protein
VQDLAQPVQLNRGAQSHAVCLSDVFASRPNTLVSTRKAITQTVRQNCCCQNAANG